MKTRDQLYRVLRISGSIVLLMLLVGVSSPSQSQEIASSNLRVDMSQLHALWFEAVALLDKEDYSSAQLKLKEVELKRVEMGFKNLPSYSEVLIKRADSLKVKKQMNEALILLEAAKNLSPDLASVHFALASTRFARNKADVYGIAQEVFWGVIQKFTDINTIMIFVNNVLGILLATSLFAGSVFIFSAFIYYRRAIVFYYFTQLIPLHLPLFIASILLWIIIGAVTLFLGIFWGILLLAALLIPHVETAGKRVLTGFLFLGSLIAILLIAIGITFSAFDGEYIQALRDIAYGNFSTKTATTLQQRLTEYPNDAYALFGLAYIASHTGHQQTAIATYESIPGIYSDRAAVQNNLGNLYNLEYRKTKRPESYANAEEAYKSAMLSARRMFEPRYNSGQLLLIEYAPEDAQEQLAAARRYNQELFTRYSGYLEYGIVTIDATISTFSLLKKMIDRESYEAGLAIAQQLWRSGSRFENPWFSSGAAFLLLLVSLFTGGGAKGVPKKVMYCQMCGEPFAVKRRRKKDTGKASGFCMQCTYIFKKKTTVKPEKRAQKINQIHVHQKFRGMISKIGSVCLPGGGQIYFGYTGKGIFFAFGFCLTASILFIKFYANALLPIAGNAGLSLLSLSISLALLIGIYLLNLSDILKLSPKNQ